MKGQGSTEYLVILAVVLVVALIVIGLLGQFTGFGSAGLEQQSKAYWQGTTPFAIVNAKLDTTSVSLEVINKVSQKLQFRSMTFDGNLINDTATNISFAPGQTHIITGDNYTPCAASGAIYQVDSIVITYDIGRLMGQTQVSDRALYGKCA